MCRGGNLTCTCALRSVPGRPAQRCAGMHCAVESRMGEPSVAGRVVGGLVVFSCSAIALGAAGGTLSLSNLWCPHSCGCAPYVRPTVHNLSNGYGCAPFAPTCSHCCCTMCARHTHLVIRLWLRTCCADPATADRIEWTWEGGSHARRGARRAPLGRLGVSGKGGGWRGCGRCVAPSGPVR